MTRYLYRYACKPNYPVVSEAMILFQSSIVPVDVHWPNLLIVGRKLAESAGCLYAGQEETVIYMGQVELVRSFANLPVLYAVTGEY